SEDESLYSTVNYHVMSLRKKVDADGEPSIIETVHGFGYRLKEVE
ncbi:MAG: winged helix-turn-helix domain-containing protein, partial [Chthonomonas sp.]|nr:winged helix-turn-helix domain-containing protein [Chthonomonas sp.]